MDLLIAQIAAEFFFRHFFLRPRKIYQYFSRYLVKAVHMEQSSIICSNGLKSRFRSLRSADSNTYDIAWYRGILSSVIMKRKRSIRTGHPRQWQIKSTELVTSIRVFPTANIFLSVRFRKLLFAIRQKDLIFVVIQLIFTDISIVFSPHSYRVPSLPA